MSGYIYVDNIFFKGEIKKKFHSDFCAEILLGNNNGKHVTNRTKSKNS